ncbi:MAG: folate-binding protein [Pseudomonadota bacterium]
MSDDILTLASRAVLRIEGADARAFLQGLITNDIEKARGDEAVYAALLTPQGKFLFDFFLLEHEGGFLLDTAAERAGDLQKRLTLYKLRADVSIADWSSHWRVEALIGDAESAPAEGRSYIDPRLAELERRRFIEGAAAEASDHEERYNAHRLKLGVPVSGFDIKPEKSFPLECNLDALNAVDFSKGCYVGQEVTSRTKRRGVVRKRVLAARRGEGGAPFEADAPVTLGEAEIGRMLSFDGAAGLALIRLDRWRAGEGVAETAGAPVELSIPSWLEVDAAFTDEESAS